MFISDFAIKKPLITVVSMVTLVLFGLFTVVGVGTPESVASSTWVASCTCAGVPDVPP